MSAQHITKCRDRAYPWELLDADDTPIARFVRKADAVACAALQAQRDELQAQRDELLALLDEVRRNFTRDDDLPDDLLPRIDAAIDKSTGSAA